MGAAVAELSYFLMIGLMAQSVALFASLLAVRRRQTHSRLDVFLYQVSGLIAAWGVWSAVM
jgi:predicted hotdog family 3-hydroxylacyl-ACP dehydratase